MCPEGITAYSNYLSDPSLLSQHKGILVNFLESCARQISESYRHTPIPGTTFTGINVVTSTIANPYLDTHDINQITVGLSVSNSEFTQQTGSSFSLYVTLEVRIYMPNPPVSKTPEEAYKYEMQWRDLRNVLAVIDGLYLALVNIPYYRDGVWTGQYIPASTQQHAYATMPVITCQYSIPVQLKRRISKVHSVYFEAEVGGDKESWIVTREEEKVK